MSCKYSAAPPTSNPTAYLEFSHAYRARRSRVRRPGETGDDKISSVRLKVGDVLSDMYHTGKRMKGVSDESALMFVLTLPMASGEAAMGSAQSLAELADGLVGSGREALALGRELLSDRMRIYDLIEEYETLSSQLDSVSIPYFGELKRRGMVGE